ncbi:MAG TPA: hypothetical protein PLY93_10215 [Turneriella sp.]|nr:hypothetical protein [Turneriella sp.]
MQKLREIAQAVIAHRAFIPALIALAALAIGALLAVEHTRNILKIRGPYLIVLTAIILFPLFAFRFFDPHEKARPISIFFVLSGVYFIYMTSPDIVEYFRMLLFERMPPGTTRQLIFGFTAYISLAGALHYLLKPTNNENTSETTTKTHILDVPIIKFIIYAVLHIIYLNLFVTIAREKFGITTMFL